MAGLPRRSLFIALVLLDLACPLRAQTPGPAFSAAQPTPVLPEPTIVPPQNGTSIYPGPTDPNVIIAPPSCEAWCGPPAEPCRTSSWNVGIDLIPSQTLVTDGEFGRWPDDGALALRLNLGYEDPTGYGIRGRFWVLGQDVSPPVDDITLSMGSFNLDLYKRVFLDRAELTLGGGPASGVLEFKLSDDTYSRFEGGGASIFADGFYGISEFEKSVLGAVARARYTLVMGDWRDTTGGDVVGRTDNDTMSIAEIAWGLEYRRRFGACQDHNWYLGILWEYQRWQSDWLSSEAATSIGVSGLNIYTGLNW
jgi:hypothetical protein